MRSTSLILFLFMVGCGEDPVIQDTGSASRRRAPVAEAPEEPEKALPPPMDFQETSFVESERSRDPFRSFARVFVDEARGEVSSQREVVLDQYAIEELKLVALVGGITPAKAMLIDPAGVGHVVQRGQYVGRASVVQPTGGVGAAYEVNWRVDRIRDGDMVLVRDDPTNPEVPSATRVLPLRSDELRPGASEEETTRPGLEDELRRMQQRIAELAAAEAAKSAGQESDASQEESDP